VVGIDMIRNNRIDIKYVSSISYDFFVQRLMVFNQYIMPS
jgi:hypothetical protein